MVVTDKCMESPEDLRTLAAPVRKSPCSSRCRKNRPCPSARSQRGIQPNWKFSDDEFIVSSMSSEKLPKMYNLNINVTTNLPNLFGLDSQANTPRTPEIVNSLVAMTNPFEVLAKSAVERNSPGSEESCSGTGSPLGSPTNSPPSVQHTRSQLIKEGLKLTIQTKRKQSGSDTKEDSEEFESKRTKREELTAEDEERRKRRRERNKIAATKCRMKKREKTANLVNESEMLETQNMDLKSQIQDLEKQRRKLMDMLSMHTPTCLKNGPGDSGSLQNHQQFRDYVNDSEQSYLTNFESEGSFNETGSDFEIGSTNGTSAMNPYGKDPNFAKLIDLPSSSSFKTYDRGYNLGDYNNVNHYQQRQKISDDNRVCYEYPSDEETFKKSAKSYGKAKDEYRAEKKGGEHDQDHEFRTNFHAVAEDVDSYKPNGIIDGNFFTNRTDIFAANDYAASFGTNPLNNGCMA